MWRPIKEGIEEWLKENEAKFASRENRNARYDAQIWLHKYVHSDLYEILFVEFLIILVERLLRLCEKNPTWWIDGPKDWIPKLVKELKETSNPISRAIGFWLDSIMCGYINDFTVDYTKSYSAVEMEFFKGLRAKYLKELKLWIKMALRDKGTFPMKNDN